MTFIKILLSSCSLIGGSFSGDIAPVLNYSRLDGEQRLLECQKMDNNKNEFVCLSEISTKEVVRNQVSKKSQMLLGTFRSAEISSDSIILSNERKSQIFHINKNQIIYHERVLSESTSAIKICSGKVLQKK